MAEMQGLARLLTLHSEMVNVRVSAQVRREESTSGVGMQ